MKNHLNSNRKLLISGFSLVELLVAMTLLIMVTLIGTYGYNLYSQYWKKELGHYKSTFESMKGVTQLHSIIKDIKPYVLKGGEKGGFFYFEGGQKVIRSVINHSLTDPDYPATFELESVERNGMNYLVYREKVMNQEPVLTDSQISSYSFEITLLSGYSDLTFEFFGWPSYAQRAEFLAGDDSSSDTREWYGFYSGKDTLIAPELVRVSVIDEEQNLNLIDLELALFVEEQLEFYLIDN